MLSCLANYKSRQGGKLCAECTVLDDENHRINHCMRWQNVNLCNSNVKVNFEDIYSDDVDKCLTVVENILLVWDLSNGKNDMHSLP